MSYFMDTITLDENDEREDALSDLDEADFASTFIAKLKSGKLTLGCAVESEGDPTIRSREKTQKSNNSHNGCCRCSRNTRYLRHGTMRDEHIV